MARWSSLAAVLPAPAAILTIALPLQPSGAALLLLLSVLAAVIVGFGWVRRAGRHAQAAHADAERRSSVLAGQVALIAPVLDESPVGFVVFDTDLRYRYINRALAAIHGAPPGDHVGRRFAEVFPESVDLLEPYVKEILRTGEPQLDQLVTAAAGRQFRVDRYPIRDAAGTITGVALTVQDITERRRLIEVQAEAERLRATAELVFKLEAAQRIAGLGSWDADLVTGETRWSRQLQEMLGVPGPTPSDDPLADAVHPDDLADAQEKVRALLEEGQPFRAEYRVRRRDGTVFEGICTGEAIPGPDGRPAGVWGTLLDVSEQRGAERTARAAIRRAEQARTQMEVEHQALQLVQAAMLPASVPKVDGLDLAVAYLPVASGAEVGGDWYDAFVLPDGRLAVAVGDVTGHDLRAATTMGQVRNAVRAYALLDAAPGRVLRHTNSLLCSLPDLDLVTMLFGVYDPTTHVIIWSRAGHPVPLLYRGGEVVSLDDPPGRLLGASDGGTYAEGRHEFAVGETLLWYTDGLLEHPDHDPRRYLRFLRERAAVPGATTSAQALVTDLTEVVIPGVGRIDDICLLAISRSADCASSAPRPVAEP